LPRSQGLIVRFNASPFSRQNFPAKAVAWKKQNFVEALDGDDLADRAHMSPSTFRQHFRALTGVSALQYRKQLRLQEARQLMLNENLEAASAGGRVGTKADVMRVRPRHRSTRPSLRFR